MSSFQERQRRVPEPGKVKSCQSLETATRGAVSSLDTLGGSMVELFPEIILNNMTFSVTSRRCPTRSQMIS